MKPSHLIRQILKWLSHYFIFFLLVAFVITCCTMLFVTALESALHITLTEADLNTAAKITFLNVAFLSLLFTILDSVRRKVTVDRPVKYITQAAEKIIQGDFSVRISEKSKVASDETFRPVIDCFNKMAQELGSVETLQTDFIANVSHEMKTPLSVLQNYGTLLQAPELDEETRIRYAKSITDASRRMAEMMTNILKLNRLENQQIFPQMTQFDLAEQLCGCLLQFEPIWERDEIRIETELAEEIRVCADAELLSLVWNNLFSNAFKFTAPGGTVRVCLTALDHHAIVQVQDTGCGMTAEVGAHIFEKFYQGDPSHSVQGNGLGLALVKRVIDILQGEIHVESTLHAGTTFTVKIRRI